jgi:hypothetical protein
MIRRIFTTVVLLGGLCGVSSFASTFIAGVKDEPYPNSTNDGTTGEGLGDYQDIVVQLSAAGLQLVTPNGAWSDFLTAPINQDGPVTGPAGTGNPFWDNYSLDGPDENIGYCLTTTNCHLRQTPAAVTQYLTANGNVGAPANDFYFTIGGATISTVLLGAIAADASTESLGIYNVTDVNQVQWLITDGVNTVGTSFTPLFLSFGLIFEVGSNTFFYSQNSLGALVDGAPATLPDNRFAMFQLPDSVPEPGTPALFAIGVLFLRLISWLRKRS